MVLVPLVNCSHLPSIRSTGCSILDRSLSLLLRCQTKCIILEVQKLLRWRALSPTADQTSSRLSRWRIVDNWFTCSRSKHRLVSLMKHICNICKINFGCITEEVKGIIAVMESNSCRNYFPILLEFITTPFYNPHTCFNRWQNAAVLVKMVQLHNNTQRNIVVDLILLRVKHEWVRLSLGCCKEKKNIFGCEDFHKIETRS